MYVKSKSFIMSILALGLLSSCEGPKTAEKKAGEAMQHQAKVPFVLVNVLDKEMFDDCHIKGSVNVPFEELETYAPKHWDKETTEIVVHCSNYKCSSSEAAYMTLTNLGFKKVWAYEGGVAEAKHLADESKLFEMEGSCTPEKSGYIHDYKKPEMAPEEAGHKINIISAEDLKKKIEEYAAKR